jgi:hypothetical protein
LGFVDPRAKLLGKTKTMEQEGEEEEEEVVVLAQNESLQESFVCLFGYQACQQDELFWKTISLAVTPCSL